MALSDENSPMPPPPEWLAWTFWSSLGIATMAFCMLVWLRWGLVSTMAQDAWKFCF